MEALTTEILSNHQEKIKNKQELLESDIKRLQDNTDSLETEKEVLESRIKTLQKTVSTKQDTASQFALSDAKQELEIKKQDIGDLYIWMNLQSRLLEDMKATKVVKAAASDSTPVSPRPVLNAVIALVLGSFLGILAAFTRYWWGAVFK
ncbi:MAG TPA: hypothetical protein ENI09_00535 [candidate division WWE3 bacterium]|uniref:Tyrosine kinase G-rich domain-containing protein n=1 Tax=candidate division WWE3 bacterium TaxID=2053526 RepID=A0A7C1NM89_UNCKA|nr:hypothetical protein [candidate division WWE3 bacterium]